MPKIPRLGSLTETSDPNSKYAAAKFLAYNSSKTALNAMTVYFAAELKDTGIKVNAADACLERSSHVALGSGQIMYSLHQSPKAT